MAATTDEMPDLETETRRLTDHLGSLAKVNDGLGAAATRVESAARVLDAAHDALRATERHVETLNESTSAALGAIDRLQPDQLRSTIESGFASARADGEQLGQRLAAELDPIARDLAGLEAAQAERHQIVVKSLADAALRLLNAVEQTQQRLAAQQAANKQAFAALGKVQASLAAALTTLRQQQQTLIEHAQAIAAVVDAVKTTADATRQTAADVEAQTSERLPALAAELHGLRSQLASDAKAAGRRQTAFFVATILLLAVAGYVVIWAIRGAL